MASDVQGKITRALSALTEALGSVPAVAAALALILGWAVTGPILHFSSDWQLVINTTTTIVTFIMVFVVQHTQNRDGRAVQAKLDLCLQLLTQSEDTGDKLAATAQRLIGIEEEPKAAIRREQDGIRADSET